nr:glycosyltransferase family A protein [Leifsonia sp. Leaf325]
MRPSEFPSRVRSFVGPAAVSVRMLRGRRRARRSALVAASGAGWVSIVIPVRDVAEYIDACLRSVLGQGHWRVEVIVLDDGSTDATPRLLRRWAQRDPRVRVVDVSVSDPNAARNHGISLARGEFLGFLDGDDVLLAGALRDEVASLAASGSDFVVGSYDRLRGSVRAPAAFWIDEAHEVERAGIRIVDHPGILVNAVQWTKLYRTAFWRAAELSFPEGGHFQDQLVSARAYARASGFDVLARPTVSWRIRDDGSSMTQQGVRAGQVRDRFGTALGALDVLARESTDAVRTARLTQYLSNDIAIAASELPGMAEEAVSALRDGLESLAPAWSDALWSDVPAESKVLYDLLLRGDVGRARAYIAAGGLDLLRHPLVDVDGVWYVELPFWGDADAAVPLVCFRAAPRELRAFATVPSTEV